MIAFIRRQGLVIAMLGALALASISGFFAAKALGVGFAGAPTKTTTVQVGGETGPTGPAGPAGPAGPPGPAGTGGADQCPTGSDFEAVVLNSPGGHVEVWTCVKQ
jgi:hypothetical protein